MKLGRKILWAAGTLFVVTFVLVGFQNCAPSLDTTQDTSFAESLPFAYETKVDQLAYLSCHGYSSDTLNTHFTFKVGAYRAGSGVRLSDDFNHETRFMDAELKKNNLQQSSKNSGAYLQLSVRKKDDLYAVYKIGAATDGSDYESMFGLLAEDPVVSQLTSGAEVRSVSGFTSGDSTRQVEGSLRFLSTNHAGSQDLRDQFTSDAAYLTVTYSDLTNPDYTFAKSSTEGKRPYGVGFALDFASTPGANRKVTGVEEYDLQTGTPTSTSGFYWTCNQYEVVKRADRSSRCPATSNPTSTLAYQALKNALGDSWEVNMANECVVLPTNQDACYGTSPVTFNDTCSPDNNCPHYLSVCYKVYR